MMSLKNPCPGMNPFLELNWPDVHTRLIGYISDAVTAGLPLDLRARAAEKAAISDEDGAPMYRADVAIKESWKQGLPPQWAPDEELTANVSIAEPHIVSLEPETLRWVEIREHSGTLVTVIELLSPTNKAERGASTYIRKQRDYINAAVNLVEIDLLRGGSHVLAAPAECLETATGTRYTICVSRASTLDQYEIYYCPLRERLPAIRVPLRESDRDAALDLQPLIDRCYENGRYWQSDFNAPLIPSLEEGDQNWLDSQLREAGLLGSDPA